MRGKIDNKYDIVMQLHFNDDHSVSGFIITTITSRPSTYPASLDNGVLELKEHDADFQ